MHAAMTSLEKVVLVVKYLNIDLPISGTPQISEPS
jgi:hypothetical protein